jgi:hypothetical protein
MRTLFAIFALLLACAPVHAGNWTEFRRLIPRALDCVQRHPGQHPKLEANVRKYQHRLAEADAMAALSPALADQLIAKPLRELREELTRCASARRARF